MRRETSNSFLEYNDQIIYVRVKEGATLSLESMREQYEAQQEMVGNDIYAVLVDGTNYSLVPPETRTFMANYTPKNRRATAVVCNRNLATLMLANFYLKVNKPKVITKLFNKEGDAVLWLREQLKKQDKN